jgi:hypothetical protein
MFFCEPEVGGASEWDEHAEQTDQDEAEKNAGMGAESCRPHGGGDDEEPAEHGDGDQREPKLPGQGLLGCGGHGIIFCWAGARSNCGLPDEWECRRGGPESGVDERIEG